MSSLQFFDDLPTKHYPLYGMQLNQLPEELYPKLHIKNQKKIMSAKKNRKIKTPNTLEHYRDLLYKNQEKPDLSSISSAIKKTQFKRNKATFIGSRDKKPLEFEKSLKFFENEKLNYNVYHHTRKILLNQHKLGQLIFDSSTPQHELSNTHYKLFKSKNPLPSVSFNNSHQFKLDKLDLNSSQNDDMTLNFDDYSTIDNLQPGSGGVIIQSNNKSQIYIPPIIVAPIYNNHEYLERLRDRNILKQRFWNKKKTQKYISLSQQSNYHIVAPQQNSISELKNYDEATRVRFFSNKIEVELPNSNHKQDKVPEVKQKINEKKILNIKERKQQRRVKLLEKMRMMQDFMERQKEEKIRKEKEKEEREKALKAQEDEQKLINFQLQRRMRMMMKKRLTQIQINSEDENCNNEDQNFLTQIPEQKKNEVKVDLQLPQLQKQAQNWKDEFETNKSQRIKLHIQLIKKIRNQANDVQEHHAKNSHRNIAESVRQKQVKILKRMLKNGGYTQEVKSKIKDEFFQILRELSLTEINSNDITI